MWYWIWILCCENYLFTYYSLYWKTSQLVTQSEFFGFLFLIVFSVCIFCLYFLIVFVKSKVKSKSKETVTVSTLWRWQHWEGYAMYIIHKNEDWQWRYIPISNSISSAYHSYDIRQNAHTAPQKWNIIVASQHYSRTGWLPQS